MIHAMALTGPTASGKTSLSLSLAKKYDMEIISCDSMQIYKKMDIGTAKATEEERKAVPHHMLDFLLPTESYSAEDYRKDAMKCASDIVKRGKTPLFVGGTGLYIDTVIRGGEVESPPSNPELKERLLVLAGTEEGRAELWERLRKVDPESAEKIHRNNVRRVARALEIYLITGKTKTYYDELSVKCAKDIKVSHITLDFHNRDNLYERVDMRVDLMMKQGLIQEVESLLSQGLLLPNTTAIQAIGYKEVLSYINGNTSLDDTCNSIKQSSRRYAKRQLTWFRHEKDAYHLFSDDENGKMKTGDALEKELFEVAKMLLLKSYDQKDVSIN